YLEMSMHLTGIMSPFVGHGIELGDITVYNFNGDEITAGYSLQWYRVNPFTYEETLIFGATNPLYITTYQDVGYYLMVKVTGDEVNIGGMMKIYNWDTVKIMNKGYVTNDTTLGFSIGFDYIIDINDLYDLEIYDMNGNLISIDNVLATADPAVFNIELDLIGVDSIYINLYKPTYTIGQYGEYHDMIGIYVYLLG
ncbi:MAG: hypothetical protein Q7I99_02695, partial [Acholeplasmataceae bacterium]|nr:hypothetical protein [Acholeplasmataceae bacterium]